MLDDAKRMACERDTLHAIVIDRDNRD
jgi:hypothetical protein